MIRRHRRFYKIPFLPLSFVFGFDGVFGDCICVLLGGSDYVSHPLASMLLGFMSVIYGICIL